MCYNTYYTITGPIVAAAVSNFTVEVFEWKNSSALIRLGTLRGHGDRVNDIKFLNPKFIVTASSDGTIMGWDLGNNGKNVFKFEVYEEVCSVACSVLRGEPICVCGREDGIVQIWSLKSNRMIAKFEDSHVEAVTRMQFHPTMKHILLTSSEDGLICVFDLLKKSEDDALIAVANTNSAVRRFGLLKSNLLWCLSSSETMSLFRIDDDGCEELKSFDEIREFDSTSGRCTYSNYLVDCMFDERTHSLLILAGDHTGHLKLLRLCDEGVVPICTLPSRGHTSTVRCVANLGTDMIITGGDDGLLCVWPRSSSRELSGKKKSGKSSGKIDRKSGRGAVRRARPY